MNAPRTEWRWYSAITAAILIVFAALAWYFYDGKASPDAVIATPSKEVKDLPKASVPIKKPLKVYSGGSKLKDKLGLPADVTQNDAKHVIASTTVNCDQPHTITTVIDAETGESQTYDQPAPRPWLARNDQSKVGVYAVFKNGTPTLSLQGRRGLFSVKSLDFVGVAGIDHPMSGTGGLGTQIGIGVEF
jgi:hypothetical protein